MAFEKTTTYFEAVGEANTEETFKAAKKRAKELGIKDIVVASTRGGTGVRAVEAFKGYNVVVVTHSQGFREPGKQELTDENKTKIEAGGGKVLTTGHAFAGVSQFIRRHWERGLQFRHLLITGGGAQAMQSRLLAQYPQAIILPAPVTANAEGMAKFAVQPRVFGG